MSVVFTRQVIELNQGNEPGRNKAMVAGKPGAQKKQKSPGGDFQ